MGIISVPHQVTRLAFDTGQPYEKFRTRYQAAVPEVDPSRLAAFAQRRAGWEEIAADADTSAPHGFFLYWRTDNTPLMSLAGNTRQCTQYLMGNHVIAEEMYRHDPAVMLYAPLRTAIYTDAGDRTRFTVDQPSTVFASFADASIIQVGIELDRKLADLLQALDIPARQLLARTA
jgi:hypothetical protein